MKILILVCASILFFLLSALLRKWRNIPVLIAVSIACAVNTNYSIGYDYPIECGSALIFGIDSLVAVLYLYILVVMCLDIETKRAYKLSFSSVAAIVLAGIIESSAKVASHGGFTMEGIRPLLFSLISGAACLFAGYLAIFVADKLKNKANLNDYAAMAIALVAGFVVHAVIFFVGFMVKYPNLFDDVNKYGACFFGSLVERAALVPLALLTYLFSNCVLKLKIKSKKKDF